MAIDALRVNGFGYSWGSITVKVGGERWNRIFSINYADKREHTKGYGSAKHQAPYVRSRGKYSAENVKVQAPAGSMQELRALLATQSDDGACYGDVPFDIVIQFVEVDETPVTVELLDCLWSGNSTTNEEGPDLMKDEAEFDCMRILRNGLALYDTNSDEAAAL